MFQAYERGFDDGLKRAGELLGENQRLKEELKEAQINSCVMLNAMYGPPTEPVSFLCEAAAHRVNYLKQIIEQTKTKLRQLCEVEPLIDSLRIQLKEAQEGTDTVYADMNRIVPELHAEIKRLKLKVEFAERRLVGSRINTGTYFDAWKAAEAKLQEATERVSVVTARQWMRLELLERVKVAEAKLSEKMSELYRTRGVRNIYLKALEILAHFPCKGPCKNKEPGKCEMWRCTGCTAREAIKAGESK